MIKLVVGGRVERENNARDNLTEEAITGLGRNLMLGNLPGIRKDDLN